MPLYIQEAERFGHNGIGCGHRFLGILANEEGTAAARRRTDQIVGNGWRDSVRWSHTPRATVVRKLAEIEAERLGQQQPDDAHTLLAMITEGEGVPIHILAECGVNPGELCEDLLDALEVPHEEREMYIRQQDAYEHARRQRSQRANGE